MIWFALAYAESVDRLDVASRLLADGHAERAAVVLSEIEDVKKSQQGRFHTLQGMVALELSDPARAAEELGLATEFEVEPTTYVFLAAARDALGDSAGVIAALDAGGDLEHLATSWTLRTRALSNLERHDEAYAVAIEGSGRFPDNVPLLKARFIQLVELGLTHEVAVTAPEVLADADEVVWLELADGLVGAGAHRDALAFSEAMLLVHPESARGHVLLGSACLSLERWHCAGEQLATAAAIEPEFAVQSAESFRRAGELSRALYMNGQVVDPSEKARQRLGLLLETRDFTGAVALDARLQRLGLLDEDAVAYALAYAHVQAGSKKRAETLLTRLTDPGLARQGTALLESL